VANTLSVFAGHTDSPLSPLGQQQAICTARYISENHKVDAVYSSDLCRAAAVGQAVADALGLPLVTDPDLREIHAGQWEGIPFTELYGRFDSYQVWLNNIGRACCDGGESVEQLQTRFVGALGRIAKAHPDQTVVIATHATPIRVLRCWCEGRSLDDMKNIPWVSNASVTEAVFDSGVFHIVTAGYDGHLGDITSRFTGKV